MHHYFIYYKGKKNGEVFDGMAGFDLEYPIATFGDIQAISEKITEETDTDNVIISNFIKL
ncbi:hypothetical protein [Paenibacillus sp. Mc5Re-14]|uniref:hypothetical protein n=1 Tax=Paenibacillus sp. Mc5Re-14 TaxID=1030529 RepID=UPI000A599CD6|nr:hypothetical protein [Paenibacillus sp. Mc5Re-14]